MVHRSRKVLSSFLRRRSVRDAVTIAGLCLVTYIAAATFDIFGQTYEFIKRYEAYELDEAIVVAIVFGFLMAIYALRRVHDLKREILKRRDAERKSANHAVRLATAVNNMSQGLLMFDSAERLVVCNERYLQMYGLSPEIVKPGVTLLQLIKHRAESGSFEDDPNQYYAHLVNDIALGHTTRQSIETSDGRTIHIVSRPMADGGWVATHEDTTDKLRVKDLIEKKELQLNAALENMSQGLCMFDATQHLVVCNRRYADLYGLNEQQTRPGTTLRAILQHRIASGNAPNDHESYINDRINEVSANKPYHVTNRLRDGRYVSVVHRPIADGGWVATHEDVTEAKRREESFRLLFDNNPVPMWVFDRESLRFLAVNEAAITHYGYSFEQFLSMMVTDLRPIDDCVRFANLLRTLSDDKLEEVLVQHATANGTIIDVCAYSRALVYAGHKARLVAIHDITDRKLAEDELRRIQKFLDAVIEHVPAPIAVKDVPSSAKDARDCRFTLLNRAGEEILGVPRRQIIGKTAVELYPKETADLVIAHDSKALWSEQMILTSDYPLITPGNGTRLVTARKIAIRGDDGKPQHLLAVLEDVTERRKSEQRVMHLAHYDTLTDLPNRATFNETLDATINRATTTGEQFAILSIDFDGFKEINDTYGHMVGDGLLREIARRLQAAAGETFLARLGGDEFAVILAEGAQPAGAAVLAERLLATLLDDFKVEGHCLKLGMSIGVAIYPADGANAKTLLTNADAALYHAKAETRGMAMFFEPEMSARLHERYALQEDLRSAIDRGELLLHYQPQVKMSGETIGFEALARWQCPKRGMVPPGTFIPIAEESSLIISLGEWVLREACREAASWPQPLTIAVNISPIQFRHGDLPRLIHSILLETGLAPARLELEITESVMINDFSRAVSILNQLKSLGVKIAMDDFGTGYSSLSYLQSFRCDKIKIDRVFICDLEDNYHSRSIVRAVISLGRSLNLPILAEGVETEAQHTFLVKEGCDEVQGYLTGRPLPIADYAGVVGRKLIAAALARAV
jgi:diguanylate cyclase (GGDEF)-like protein/PAS domain S-box-containing protein